MSSNNNTKPTQLSTLQSLSKQLKVNEKMLIKTAIDLGLDPDNLSEGEAQAIANHLTGNKPTALNGKPPETPKQPESFSINDSEDFIDWEEIEEELGETALVLLNELGLEREAVTRSDFVALKELALSNPVAEDMMNHISAVGGLSGGLVDEYLRQQRDNAQALADAGNIEFAKTLLQGQMEGIKQVVGLQNLLADDFQASIQQRIEELGNRGKERPEELIKDLGKRATVAQQSSQKSKTIRHNKLDLVGLKSKISKQK